MNDCLAILIDRQFSLALLGGLPVIVLQFSMPPAGLAGKLPAISNEAPNKAFSDPSPLVTELKRLQNRIKEKGTEISLEEAVELGIKNNPALLDSFSTIQQYEWYLIAAQRRWYPTLQLANGSPFAGYSWETFVQNQYGLRQKDKSRSSTSDSNVTPSDSSVTPSDSFPESPLFQSLKSQAFKLQPGVTASWTFFDPTRQPDINAAVESLEQQKLLFNASARNLVLNLQQAYYEIQSNQKLIESFNQIYVINKQQLDILEAQKEIGMATVLDVEQTRSQLFAQLSELVSYTQSFIQSTAKLSELLALPPGQLAIPSDPASIRGQWTQSIEETIQAAIHQREEILASLAAAESAKWTGISAIRSYLPVFSLIGRGSLNYSNGFSNVDVDASPDEAYEWNSNWSANAGIGFSWSIFDGGIRAAEAQSSYSQSRRMKAQAASTELEVVRQVETSYGSMLTSKVSLTSANEAYHSAQLAQEAARARFSIGVGNITSVVQTIQQLSTAAQQVAQAILSYNNSIAELYRYSATWPENTKQDVDHRIEKMRNRSPKTNVSTEP